MTYESTPSSQAIPVSILVMIVIYKIRPQESSSLRTLLDAIAEISGTSINIGILIWDNTPGGQDPGDLPEQIRYRSAPGNPGLARAYNHALEMAQENGYSWLTLLDQDTMLPSNFFVKIGELANRLEPLATIGSIVPLVVGDNRTLSPFQFRAGILPRWFRSDFTGVPQQITYAVNSASTFRVSSLSQVGGYDPLFPLDVSDINLFHKLHHYGKRVFVAGGILVHHELALLNKQQRMSLERYRYTLMDECAFWDIQMGPLARLERMIRLAGRACKDSLNPDEIAFRDATLSELKRRLVTARKQRIKEWDRLARARLALASEVKEIIGDSRKETQSENAKI